jgi:CMP-N-acetylneuraminic acid synthetase
MSYTAFIPARSGSKRLPNKNMLDLGGKPLMMWTVEACVNVEKISKVIISTDSNDYWDAVTTHCNSQKLVLDLRTAEEAGDNVKIFDYLKMKREELFINHDEAFVLTLPTVPLRTSQQINEAIHLFESHGSPVFSASLYSFPLSFAFAINEDSLDPLFIDSPLITGNTRSQDQKEFFHPNGAIYVRSSEDLDDTELMSLYRDARPYLMDRKSSIDIDDESDLMIAKSFLSA